MNQDVLARSFFFGVFLILIFLVSRILRPFFEPIAWAVVLTIVFAPLHGRILARMGRHKNTAAALTTLVVTLITIGPFIWFVYTFVSETIQLYPLAQNMIRQVAHLERQSLSAVLPLWGQNLLGWVVDILHSLNVDPHAMALQVVQAFTGALPALGGRVAVKSVVVLIDLLALIVTVFFCLRDGREIIEWIQSKVPMQGAHKTTLLSRLAVMVVAIVRGILLTAVIQGVLAGLGYWVAGVSYPVLLGFATTLFAIIPFGGAIWIWLPVVIYLWTAHQTVAAVLLMIWCVLMVSTFDNFLRPYFIGAQTKLPFLLTFFGILGGVAVYGPLGIVLGPVIIAAVLAFIQIFEEEYFDANAHRGRIKG